MAPAPKKDAEDAATTLVKLQTEQFAYKYVVGLRPKNPFDGESGKLDFEHYLKEFERAQSMPGLSAELRLGEYRFWWVGLAGLKVARFLLRKDVESAIEEAMEVLVSEF